MNLNLLVALDALLTEETVTRAAERVHLSPSAMSGALAQLRHHFRDELMVHVGRRMMLTPLAESLKGPVREVLQLSKSIMNASAQFDASTSQRTFSIVSSDVISLVLMSKVVAKLSQIAPQVKLDLFDPDPQRLTDDLERGAIDLLIVPQEYASEEFPEAKLYEDTYSCLVWSENSQVGDELTVENFEELQHVVLNFGRARTDGIIGSVVRSCGIELNVGARVPAFGLLSNMIMGTNRIATVPTRLAQMECLYKPLRMFKPPIEFPKVVEVMQWHAYQNTDPGLVWLRQFLEQVAGSMEQEGKGTPARTLSRVGSRPAA
ncbi:MAG: LysR family transcriptional regulator [Steroidobacteraceae bacterium]